MTSLGQVGRARERRANTNVSLAVQLEGKKKKKLAILIKPSILFLIRSWNWQINTYFTYGYNYPRTVVSALITSRCQADFQSISFTADTYLNTSITLSHTSWSINPRSLVSIQLTQGKSVPASVTDTSCQRSLWNSNLSHCQHPLVQLLNCFWVDKN